MNKIELPIVKDYVSGWTINHALREIFQNAFDREIFHESKNWMIKA